jgi:hypothetical protein
MALTWAQRLKRICGIEIETSPACGGTLRIVACLEDPVVIEEIFFHVETKYACSAPSRTSPLGRRRRPI